MSSTGAWRHERRWCAPCCPRAQRRPREGARPRAVAQTDPYLFFAHKYSTHIPERRKPTRSPGLLPLPSHFCGHQLLKRRLERPAGGETTTLRAEVVPRATCCADKLRCAWTSAYPWRLRHLESSEKLEQCLRRPGQGGSRRRPWVVALRAPTGALELGRRTTPRRSEDRTAT